MKFVALLSGGKDSCYNIVHCNANGHELVAAASLRPPTEGEMDSFMYQTVGQDAIELVANALGVPLFRRTIDGLAIEQGGEYGDRAGKADRENEGVDGDETEDMFALLSEVKEAYPDVQGVSVGAILSNYQRVRVDHVCQRLGLTPLCYLWQRDQRELMSEMIAAGVEAILIKVAGIGLEERHLGKTLAQMEPTFHKLNDKFGAHICGEGGEYETLTLDCSAFKRRITIKETKTVVHSDHGFATVAYLRIKGAVLEDKPQSTPLAPTVPPLLEEFSIELELSLVEQQQSEIQDPHLIKNPVSPPIDTQVIQQSDWLFISNVQCNLPIMNTPIEEEVIWCFDSIKSILEKSDLSLQPKHIVNTVLLLSDMNLFPRVNKAYAQYFGTSPPSRACVAVDLPEDQGLDYTYKVLVTGLPQILVLNSQAITVQCQTFISGQIGLIPARMDLPSPPSFPVEAALAFQHAERILDALKDASTSVIQGVIVWVDGADRLELGRRAWDAYAQASDRQLPATIIAAKSLPRGAMIEVQVLAHSNSIQSTDPDSDDDSSSAKVHISTDGDLRPEYEYRVRKIGLMSSFATAFASNEGLSSVLSTLPVLGHHEALSVLVFYCPGTDFGVMPHFKATFVPVRGILSPSGKSWSVAFYVHVPTHSKTEDLVGKLF
ncbi:Diphthamide synthase [Rhizoctonia solani]|uniref:Diphthine--ammonia ligase n=1 Tax=Rhizoctonia solani TaxID=456999 RepID=A0A8H7M8N0_9AGAM|nr:Diphthamide synthase [Rhizoctonia solani]